MSRLTGADNRIKMGAGRDERAGRMLGSTSTSDERSADLKGWSGLSHDAFYAKALGEVFVLDGRKAKHMQAATFKIW